MPSLFKHPLPEDDFDEIKSLVVKILAKNIDEQSKIGKYPI